MGCVPGFLLGGARDSEIETRPKLVEHEALLNPDKAVSDRVWTGNRRSGRTSSPSGRFYALDDQRAKHQQEVLRRLAQRVVNNAMHQSDEQDPHLCCLVCAARKKVISAMRAEWLRSRPRAMKSGNAIAISPVRPR